MSRCARAAVFLAVLVTAALAISLALELRPRPAWLRCSAALPDGTVHTLDAAQSDNAALIAAVATARGMPARAVTIGLATALQESKLENLDHGDRDSLGLFQQRPSQGWGTPEQIMDPHFAAAAFFKALARVDGYETMEITDAAQAVQRSAYPQAYARHEPTARAFASALTGNSPAALTCDLPLLKAQPATMGADFTARLGLDWGSAESAAVTADGGAVSLQAPAILPGLDAQQAAWALAQWAVATAQATGVSQVQVEDMVWSRGGTWTRVERSEQPGAVVVR